jgi:hypothetical protein
MTQPAQIGVAAVADMERPELTANRRNAGASGRSSLSRNSRSDDFRADGDT